MDQQGKYPTERVKMQILVIDPGMTTGLVLADYWQDEGKLTILGRWAIGDGLDGLLEWDMGKDVPEGISPVHDVVIFEKFRVGPRTYRRVELEPLSMEGMAKVMFGSRLVMQYNDSMLIGGTGGSPAENKKAADAVLRDMGLWSTGKQVGHKDANDVNAAMKHLVAYLRREGHEVNSVEVL